MPTVKKQSLNKQPDKSDVLSILQSIEGLYNSYLNVLNVYTQTTLLLSMTFEAQMLLMKLRVMRDRWAYHLPFKEACAVDFYDWSKKIETISQHLGGNEDSNEGITQYCPSKHFMLDLYEMLPDNAPSSPDSAYYRELNIPKLVATQDKIRRLITKQWKEYNYKFSNMIADQVDERIPGFTQPLAERSVTIRMTCHDVLRQLSIELNKLYEMPSGVISRDRFARLAERVISEPEYGGRKAQTTARREVEELRNTTPEEEWEACRKENIATSIDIISEMKYGRRIFNFLGRNYNLEKQYPAVGKFLNSVRRQISEDELSFLMEQLFRILYLSEDPEHPESAKSEEQTASTQSGQSIQTTEDNNQTSSGSQTPNPKDAQAVYQRRVSIQPEHPRLPPFFSEAFDHHPEAVQQFYDIFHHCGFYIGRALLDSEKRDRKINYYADWKWKHVREAFIKLKFIISDTPKNALADYFESVFPYLDANNVKRGFNSRGTYENETIFNRIVHDIECEFQSVKDMLDA